MSDPGEVRVPAHASLGPGTLVVLAGRPGVFRLERALPGGRWRAFSYIDGAFVEVAAAEVAACPPGTRAAP
jgi:hypothetical protein